MILFLDDEIFAKPYIDTLKENGFEVESVTHVYQALKSLNENPEKYNVLILDCMLPANSKDVKILNNFDIKNGLRTGSAFLDYLVDNEIAPKAKIIILTNILDEQFHFKYKMHKRLSGCYMKREIKPKALTNIIIDIIKGGN